MQCPDIVMKIEVEPDAALRTIKRLEAEVAKLDELGARICGSQMQAIKERDEALAEVGRLRERLEAVEAKCNEWLLALAGIGGPEATSIKTVVRGLLRIVRGES